MTQNVKPTRSELMELKKRIKLAKSGYNLLKKKRDGLILDFFEILKKVKNVRGELTEEYKRALQKMSLARVIESDLKIRSVALAVANSPEVEIGRKNIMGVVVPNIGEVELRKTALNRGYGLYTSAAVDEAAAEFGVLGGVARLVLEDHPRRIDAERLEDRRHQVRFLLVLFEQAPRAAGEHQLRRGIALGQRRHREQAFGGAADRYLAAVMGQDGIDDPARDDDAVHLGRRRVQGGKAVFQHPHHHAADGHDAQNDRNQRGAEQQALAPSPPPGLEHQDADDHAQEQQVARVGEKPENLGEREKHGPGDTPRPAQGQHASSRASGQARPGAAQAALKSPFRKTKKRPHRGVTVCPERDRYRCIVKP